MTELILPTGTVPSYATISVFPLSARDGAIATAIDTDYIYVFNQATTSWLLRGSGASSGGTVTSVALTAPDIFSVAGSPITTAGSLDITLATQVPNRVFAGPDSGVSSAAPTFRTLVSADIPNLSSTYVLQSAVGAANGVASLDGAGKVPVAQLPNAVFIYQGLWDPATNTPTLIDGTGTQGYVYYVSDDFAGPIVGLSNPSMINFQLGDLVIYNGTQYQLTTPAAGVSSVNGMQGVVVLHLGDLSGVVLTTPSSGQFLSYNGTDWVNASIPGVINTTEDIITLNSTNITNQYVELAHAATGSSPTVNSVVMNVVGGPEQLKGVDYTVSLTGGTAGVTKITFAGGLATSGASELIAGDILMIQYSY